MRIAYIGNFTQRHCTENHLAQTLEAMGHEVERWQENGEELREWLGYLLQAANAGLEVSGLDLLLYTRTWGETVELQHLEAFKKLGIPTASYHLDLYVGLSRKWLHKGESLETMLQTDPFWRTDFVFTPDGDPESAEVFKANGVKHYYIRPGVFGPECYMAERQGDFKYDVLFVGGGDNPGSPNGYGHPEWPYRDELIKWLRDTYGDRFKKVGHPQETVRNEELNQLYADAKVVIGDSVCLPYGEFTHSYYWSDRVYETIGRGGFLIHPYIFGLGQEFDDRQSIVFYNYGNFDQLKASIDYYLEHDEEREAIRKAGHELVKQDCTYRQRLEQALGIIENAKLAELTETELPDDYVPISAERISDELIDALASEKRTVKINLGAGSEPTPGWVNVDWIEGEGINVVHNLLKFPWPFGNGVADEIKAIDVLEHMPAFNQDYQSVPIKFIEECWRILQPGGKLTIQVPHFNSPNLWIDPTHVRGYDPRSLDYFDPDTDLGRAYGYYSKCKFKVTADVSHIIDDARPHLNGAPSNVTFTMVKL